MRTYKTKEVIEITGGAASQNQLVHWAEKGIVLPSYKDADGHGSYRLYTFKDLIKVMLVSRFLGFGMSLKTIRAHLNWFENKADPNFSSDHSGIAGEDGKAYTDLWEGLKLNRDAFRYYYEIKNAYSRIEYGFTGAILSEDMDAEYALFINISNILSELEKATGDTV
jgi:DNA-binding transcriptional MerR regulator